MSGICSQHRDYHPECRLCNVTLKDDPELNEARLRAIDAGLHKCECGFEYYMTVLACPLCGKDRNLFLHG
jgi:hypothetical protein